jgi:RimJ/RimL family protein N-acetyltransferase
MNEPTAKKTVNLDCGKYLVRTATVADATDLWGSWMADAEVSRMLNAPAKPMSKTEVASYIRTFDQKTHLLLGIFQKSPEKILGFLRIDIDEKLNRCLVSMMIGEAEHRNKGVTNAITPPFRDYFFETLGLKLMLATALSHNEPIIHYLLKTGFNLDKTIERHVKSRTDDAMLGLCFFSQTADAWREWKNSHLPRRDQNIVSDNHGPNGLK